MKEYVIKGGSQETVITAYCPNEAVKIFVAECLETSGTAPSTMMVGTREEFDDLDNYGDDIILFGLKWVLEEMGIKAKITDI